MRLLVALQLFLQLVLAKKSQIGHIPTKGNLWRAKFPHEIVGNVSGEFEAFSRKCRTTSSEETGITYYYTVDASTAYPYVDNDTSICAYSLERNLPPDEITGQATQIANFTLYFACDDTCCAMECCQRDIQMTIIGLSLIGISLLILVFYVTVYLAGLVCAWRNGALGRRHTVSARQPNNNCLPADTTLMVIKNGNFDQQC